MRNNGKDVHPWSPRLVACAERMARRFADRWSESLDDPYRLSLRNILFWVDAFLLVVRASVLSGSILALAHRMPIMFATAALLTVLAMVEVGKWM